jgi:hypothetical protein
MAKCESMTKAELVMPDPGMQVSYFWLVWRLELWRWGDLLGRVYMITQPPPGEAVSFLVSFEVAMGAQMG